MSHTRTLIEPVSMSSVGRNHLVRADVSSIGLLGLRWWTLVDTQASRGAGWVPVK